MQKAFSSLRRCMRYSERAKKRLEKQHNNQPKKKNPESVTQNSSDNICFSFCDESSAKSDVCFGFTVDTSVNLLFSVGELEDMGQLLLG